MDRTRILKKLLFIAGLISLSIGIVGIVVPLLPTTPFILLSATCFLHSSKRMHYWLTHNKIFGFYIIAYQKYRGIPRPAKVSSLVVLWLTIGSTVVLVIEAVFIKTLLLIIAICVTIHLIRIRTLSHAECELIKSGLQSTDTDAKSLPMPGNKSPCFSDNTLIVKNIPNNNDAKRN